MDKMLVVVFNDEIGAAQGLSALKALDADGSIALYATAVISKDPKGMVTVQQAADQGPLGTTVGLFTGSLLGLWAGPVGFAVAAGTGMLGGLFYDLVRSGVSQEFLAEVGAQLEPGMAALVAEVNEDWIMPVDARMEALRGKVFRRARQEVLDAQLERELEANRQELASLKAELARANAAQRARLETRLGQVKAKLQAAQERTKASIAAITKEGEAKLALLEHKAEHTVGEARVALQERIERTRSETQRRREKLQRAWDAARKELEA